MPFSYVPITGTYLTADGKPSTGYILFTLTAPMLNGGLASDTPIRVTLDATGSIPAGTLLAANNDPGTTPGTTAYRVTERIDRQMLTLFLRVEAGIGPIDLPSRAAGIVAESPELYQRLSGRGKPHGYAPLDADGLVPLANLPAVTATGGTAPLAFTQSTPAAVWGPITHNRGYRPPSVALFSADFSEQYTQFSVLHLSNNALRISMDTPTAGVALIG